MVFKDADTNPASAMMNSIQATRGTGVDSPMVKLAVTGKYEDYAMSLIPYVAPWAVLFILSVIGW